MPRYAEEDPYTYPNSSVLINIPGYRSQEELNAFERRITLAKMLSEPPPGNFDYEHLKSIHKHLFEDIYEWAGQERNVPIIKGDSQFATPAFIHQQAILLFKELHEERFFQYLPENEFARKAAHFVLELNVIHPFRDGNGRALRLFLLLLAENAGYTLKPKNLEKSWLDACTKGFLGTSLQWSNCFNVQSHP